MVLIKTGNVPLVVPVKKHEESKYTALKANLCYNFEPRSRSELTQISSTLIHTRIDSDLVAFNHC